MSKKNIIFIIVFLLTVIGFFLRVLPFGYGMSHIYFSDTPLFSRAMELANGIAKHDFSQFIKPSYYPYFFSYLFLFVFGIFYLIGIIGGIFSSTNEFLKYSILEMEHFLEISRIVIAVSGTLLIPLVYSSTKKLLVMGKKKWIEAGALLSAFLMGFSVLHIDFSHLVRPHLAVAFTLFLSFYFYLILLKNKNLISYILLGVAAGISAGTLHDGLLAFFLLLMAHFFIISQQNKERKDKKKIRLKNIFSFPFIAALIAFALVVFICWPYLFLRPGDTLGLGSGKIDFTLSGQNHHLLGSFTGQGWIIALRGLVLSETSLVIILLSLLIICFVFLRKKRGDGYSAESFYYKAGIRGGIFILISHFFIFDMYNIPSYRFLVPLIPFLCVFVGILLSKVLESTSNKQRVLLIFFVVVILTFAIIQSVRLTVLITRKDTRDLTADWIERNINPSKMITIASTGPKFFPNKKSLEKKLSITGPESLGQRDNFLLSLNAEEYPKNSRSIFPLWAFDNDYEKIQDFIKNQSDYFVFISSSLSSESDLKINPARDIEQGMALRLGTLIKTFSPFKKASNHNSIFPVKIDNPIIDLWILERMGPIIEIYKINH